MEGFDRLQQKGSEPFPSPWELMFVIKHRSVVLSSITATWEAEGGGRNQDYLFYYSIRKVIELPCAAGRKKETG